MADPDAKFCPECGTQLARRAKFCVGCGAAQALEPTPDAAAEPAEPDPQPLPTEPGAAEAPIPEPTPPDAPPAREPPSSHPAPAGRQSPSAAPEAVSAPEAPGPELPSAGPQSPGVRREAAHGGDAPPPQGPQPDASAPGPEASRGTPGTGRAPLRERVAAIDPDAGELVGRGAAVLSIPGVVAAGLTALIAGLITLAAGFVLAVLFPDGSLIGNVGQGAGIVTEAFRQVPRLLSAEISLEGAPVRTAPVLLVLIPLAASALAARAQGQRIADLSPQWRVVWALGAGLAFALLALLLTLFGGGDDAVEPSLGDTFGLALLWGSVGALLGAGRGAGGGGAVGPSDRGRDALAIAGACLRPLAAVLVLSALLGLWGWVVQTARDVDNTQIGRSEAVALAENGLFFVEHGVHLTELGALVRFEGNPIGALGLPFPVEDAESVAAPGEEFGIFAYREALPAYVFVPGLILLVALVAVGALLAGFRVARTRGAASPGQAALWGAIVGPAWAIAVAALSALASKQIFGEPSADSVFVSFLVGGAALGALGGFLAGQGSAGRSTA